MSERTRIAKLRTIFSRETRGVSVAIGDDAAVLTPANGELVWTVDEQVEGTHFRLDLLQPEDLGWRSVMAAASDLAAMGALPWCALASLVLPKSFSEESFEAIARGQRAACDALSAGLVGGNLARGEGVSITTTWLGTTKHPLQRNGARVGDRVWLAGNVGLAAAGFSGLQRGIPVPDPTLSAWRRPVARISDGQHASAHATAAIDVSDGLAGDLNHIAEASGVMVVLDAGALLAALHPALFVAARALDQEPLDLALDGGEDYAIACTSPSPIEGFVQIGEVREGQGVWLHDAAHERRLGSGFDHF
jgi:thiamine-monophosphate kinase